MLDIKVYWTQHHIDVQSRSSDPTIIMHEHICLLKIKKLKKREGGHELEMKALLWSIYL